MIDAGDEHSLALKTGGETLGLGLNVFGQVGDGTVENKIARANRRRYAAISASKSFLSLKTDGTIWRGVYGNGQLGDGTMLREYAPVLIGPDYASISAGGDKSMPESRRHAMDMGNQPIWQLGDGTLADKSALNKSAPVMQ